MIASSAPHGLPLIRPLGRGSWTEILTRTLWSLCNKLLLPESRSRPANVNTYELSFLRCVTPQAIWS